MLRFGIFLHFWNIQTLNYVGGQKYLNISQKQKKNLMGEKNFQNPRRTIEKSQFYLIEGFWCKNPQWGKSKEIQKIQKWILKVFFPIKKKFVFCEMFKYFWLTT